MLKRVLTILRRDLVSVTRDSILLYVLLMPLLLSFGLRFFLPSVGQTSVNVVLLEETADTLQERLARYLNVEMVSDEEALRRRVLAYDDTVGVIPGPGADSYELLLEGNESHDARVLPAMVLQQLAWGEVEMPMVEVGEARVPYREWIGAFVTLSVTFLASIVMGLHIIEDKESGMMEALGVTPLQRHTYVLARGIFVLLMAQVTVFSSLLALGLLAFNSWQLFLVTLSGSLTAILFGFALGALSSNQITGIANLKFGFLLVLLPAVLTILLPSQWQVALYWLPSYWTFAAYKALLVDGASWSTLLPLLLANLGVSLLYLVGTYPWFRSRLDFASV